MHNFYLLVFKFPGSSAICKLLNFSSIHFFFLLFLIFFFFWTSLWFIAKLREGYRDFPHTPCPHLCASLSCYQHPPQRGTFVKIDKPSWTHHCHSKYLFYIGFTLGAIYSVGLDLVHFFIAKFVFYILEFVFNSFYIFLLRFSICIFIMIIFSFLAPGYTVDLRTTRAWTMWVHL